MLRSSCLYVSQSAPPSDLALCAWWGQVSASYHQLQPTGLQPPPLQYNMASPPLKTANLQARYRSPNAEKIFCHDFGVSEEEPTKQLSTAKKVAYLATLR